MIDLESNILLLILFRFIKDYSSKMFYFVWKTNIINKYIKVQNHVTTKNSVLSGSYDVFYCAENSTRNNPLCLCELSFVRSNPTWDNPFQQIPNFV